MIIDSHMHINSKVINDVKNLINKINNNKNIESVINVGMDIETSRECVKISNTEKKFYTSIGIHPLYIKSENFDELYNLINDKVVAIGEIGLDSNHSNYYEQRQYFIRQIFIANELKLPVIIHTNNNEEIINIFKKGVKPKYGCVFHCFKPDLETLKYIVDNGYFISFAGKITYKNAKKSIEVIKEVPNTNFLVETDSPYISPEPFRDKINESSNIKYIIEKISEVKEVTYTEIEEITNKNTKILFKKMRWEYDIFRL